MRVAIASTGNTLDSILDKHFGRCPYFVVYDTDSKAMEFIPNPYKDADEGAGTSSIDLVISRKVSKIISGEFGMKIKSLLDSQKIQMIIIKDSGKKIKEIIDLLNVNK
ncbi:MAG: NifB/NifX family molybdenum-iron cluster-binding protein [Bacteroidales bacterium]